MAFDHVANAIDAPQTRPHMLGMVNCEFKYMHRIENTGKRDDNKHVKI